jgi:aldehyde:ferredoxin oxidoreductase
MMGMKGYMGKVLVVDLSAGTFATEDIPDAVYETVLSGVGLGAWYLYRNIPAGADALGPENILGFTSGLLTGSGSVMTGRWMAVCKSPLTGGWGDSNCGGTLAPAIKQCGYDAIFVRGVAEKPVYLYIDNKGPQIRDASAYWGLDAVEAEEALVRDTRQKKKPEVAVIGQGGEKLSLIAGISNDLGRYAARSGVGAVMGSKRLKALVLAGSKAIKAADPEAAKRLSVEYAAKVRKNNAPGILKGGFMPIMGKAMGSIPSAYPMDGMLTVMFLKKYGTPFNNTLGVNNGDSPLRNWAGSNADYNRKYYKNLDPDRFAAREERKYHCYSCIVGCGGICDIKDIKGGKFPHTHKPEYETAMVFGGLLMNKDLDSIFYINELCNRAGLDTIGVGGTVAFAIECFEAGLLTEADTGGLKLAWGDAASIVALVEKIIAREGIGDILADGSRKAAERIGKGSERFAVHAGGQELPMHDPKVDPMLGVTYSADPTPGRHTTSGGLYYSTSFLWDYVSWAPRFRLHPKSEDYEPTEVEAMKNVAMTSYKMLIDGSGSCYYAMMMGVQHFKIFDYLNAATGWGLSPDEYMEMGKRIQTLRQLFNAKQGVDLKTFRMHDRAAGKPPLKDGHNKGITLKIDEMVPQYWKAWGWDEGTGVPTKETFEALGLGGKLGLEYLNG